MDNTKEKEWSEKNVLVGTLRNRNQLDVCLKHKFYHIPARYISENNFPIEYVSIYQSKKFFGANCGIYWYGRVSDAACLKRSNILEIPKNSNEYYYRFDVESWEKLNKPIEIKEKGYVRIFTNLNLLFSCHEFPELLLNSRREFEMYNDIKRSILKVQKNPECGDIDLLINGIIFKITYDDIVLYENDKPKRMYSVYDFLEIPTTVFMGIRRDMKRIKHQ